MLFGTVMAVIIPPIWVYGWTGDISLDTLKDSLLERRDLESSGELVAHLWFLYYLMLMYAALVGIRYAAAVWQRLSAARIAPDKRLSLTGSYLIGAVYTRIPLLLALAAVLLLILRGGNESKPIWPWNLPDLLYGMLFFFYGYGLYARRDIIEKLKETGTLCVLLTGAGVAYLVHLGLLGAIDEASSQGAAKGTTDMLWAIETLFYGASAALFSVGLLGLFERALTFPRAWVRWLADSSYWIYILHLPLVAFLTFYLSHLDRQGWLKYFTGIEWNAEMKFLVSCLVTGVAGVVTYRYLVRYTIIGRC